MSMIQRDPTMHPRAFTGKFHIVNLKTNLSIQSEGTRERAESCVQSLHEHEAACAKRRAENPAIERREINCYWIAVEE